MILRAVCPGEIERLIRSGKKRERLRKKKIGGKKRQREKERTGERVKESERAT